MKISYTVNDCRDKISPACTGTFKREIKRGRPQVNCDACKAVKVPVKKISTAPHQCNSTGWDCMVNNGVQEHHRMAGEERTCPCGEVFKIKPGRGRKAEKCEKCREAGTVYRTNDEGTIEAIRAETLAEEQREKAEEAGRERAKNLCELMKPLLSSKKERKVIVH